MTQPALLDFDALSAPISESEPCGSNFDSGKNIALGQAFSELRAMTPIARRIEARRFELAGMGPADRQVSLSHSEGKSDGPQADPKWGRIAELAIEILTKHSKDTRVLVCLIESMTRLYGLPGLRDSLKAGSLLVDQYKLSLFPLPDPGEKAHYCLEFIGNICKGETNNIKSALYQAGFLKGDQGLCWFSYISATNLEKRPAKEKEVLIQSGELTLEHFRSALNLVTEAAELTDFDQQLTEAINEAKIFDAILTTHSKSQVGINQIIEDLGKLQRWYRGLIADRLTYIAASTPAEQVEANVESSTASKGDGDTASTGAQSSISNREQALGKLLQVATYFRNSEPHSPVSYALEQAVRWGKMPLPELLRDLVANDSVLTEVYRRMGIQENKGNSD
ncbi:MAG TPA: type VI secretion system protein TssA [Pirellula sp.]|nr:type VI secretion system protein TssA [Pirellula sp.]